MTGNEKGTATASDAFTGGRLFWVPDVVAKQRPRLSGRGVYTPSRTKNFEKLVGWCAKAAGYTPIDGPVHVTIRIVFAVPASWSKKKRAEASGRWAADNGVDIDNVMKSALDGLNSVAYHDDRQVCSVTATKVWGGDTGCWIKIERVEW